MKQKIRIKLKSINSKTLDQAVKQIIAAVSRAGASVEGPIALPNLNRNYVVNRSPHVNKKSREHFVVHIHKRLLIIEEATKAIMDGLTNLVLPAGVDVAIKLLEVKRDNYES